MLKVRRKIDYSKFMALDVSLVAQWPVSLHIHCAVAFVRLRMNVRFGEVPITSKSRLRSSGLLEPNARVFIGAACLNTSYSFSEKPQLQIYTNAFA